MAPSDQLHQRIFELVAIACSHPPNSVQRRRYLTKIVRLIQSTNQIWKESAGYYEEALQQTWIYFCLNLCEAKTSKEPYNPELGKITSWLNGYLKMRLQDCRAQINKEKKQRFFLLDENSDLENILEAPQETPPILEDMKKWVESDPQKVLSSIHIRRRPDLTAQVVILRRLPPETSWKQLSFEWNISISTLSAFYERKCRPLLRKFGENSGYI